MNSKNPLTKNSGFTLVELLVVITIIGTLIALLLPAVQSAREAARRTQCSSNLKQISLGVLHHELVLGHFPFGGWGHEWVGVPGRGSGERQPGGWVYNTLPYLELQHLHQLGSDPEAVDTSQLYSQRLRTPVYVFTCPTRRPCSTWRTSDRKPYFSQPKPIGDVSAVARGDYAINAGASLAFSWPGPDDLQMGDDPTADRPKAKLATGISHLRFGVKAKRITDGLSHTYLVGEKFLNPEHYFDGESRGDNETLYSGYATDLHRFTQIDLLPLQDAKVNLESRGYLRFGSAHSAGCHFALCDGSVKIITFEVAAETHYQFGHRSDQGTVVAGFP